MIKQTNKPTNNNMERLYFDIIYTYFIQNIFAYHYTYIYIISTEPKAQKSWKILFFRVNKNKIIFLTCHIVRYLDYHFCHIYHYHFLEFQCPSQIFVSINCIMFWSFSHSDMSSLNLRKWGKIISVGVFYFYF